MPALSPWRSLLLGGRMALLALVAACNRQIEPPVTPLRLPPPASTLPAAAQPADPSATPSQPAGHLSLALVAGGFDRPVYLTHAGDARLFVVEQAGQVWILDQGRVLPEPFLDIRQRVGSQANEQGLLSLAFQPANPARFYADYTNFDGDTVIAEFALLPGQANRADPASERILLTIPQPFPNHNGGQLQFAPDGTLFIGMGDGGSGGDPQGNGQDPATLLGSLLRLDIEGGEPYAIPADNPFVGDEGKRNEIWAFGLRNPWRFSFDRLTGDLFLGDVGQNEWEEIDFVPAGSPGGLNFGWNVLEGSHCFRQRNCQAAGTVLPIAEYGHAGGNCSVTGGYVYRGAAFPALSGNYFFADFCSGMVWGLFPAPDGSWQTTLLLDTNLSISSFGQDAGGELYLLDHSGGQVFQLQP